MKLIALKPRDPCVQAFVLYEENIADSKAQLAAITQIVGTLQGSRSFSTENYDTLTTKCALYSNKLLKKPDQCLAIQLCSHLFWAVSKDADAKDVQLYHDGKRVLECLQKSLKIADACMEASVNVQLFVEILNRYLYYYEKRAEAVTVKYINGLIDLISTNAGNMDASDESEAINRHYRNTLLFIQNKKQKDTNGPPYDEIQIQALERFNR